MTRAQVRNFLGLGIDLLTDVTYGTGRISEWNSNRSRTYPMAWIESLSVDTELANDVLPYDNWNIVIHIAKQDAADSVEDEYEGLVNECDELAQYLIRYYNQVVDGYKLTNILSPKRNPFIKKNADCLTGVILAFTLRSPDTTNLC